MEQTKLKEEVALDMILRSSIQHEWLDISIIKKELFKDLNDAQITDLILKINTHDAEIADIEFGKNNTIINSNGCTQDFLNQGGFTAIYKQQELKKEKEFKNIELKKATVALELTKKLLKEFPQTKLFARIALIIATLLAVKELYLWLRNFV